MRWNINILSEKRLVNSYSLETLRGNTKDEYGIIKYINKKTMIILALIFLDYYFYTVHIALWISLTIVILKCFLTPAE